MPESEALVKEQIDRLRGMLSDAVVLVVYVRGIVGYLNDAKFERVYVLPANNQVTLLGHAVNGAYVAYGDRITTQDPHLCDCLITTGLQPSHYSIQDFRLYLT